RPTVLLRGTEDLHEVGSELALGHGVHSFSPPGAGSPLPVWWELSPAVARWGVRRWVGRCVGVERRPSVSAATLRFHGTGRVRAPPIRRRRRRVRLISPLWSGPRG